MLSRELYQGGDQQSSFFFILLHKLLLAKLPRNFHFFLFYSFLRHRAYSPMTPLQCHKLHCSASAPFSAHYLSPLAIASAPPPHCFQYCSIIADIRLSITLSHLLIFTALPRTSLLPLYQPTAPYILHYFI